MSEAISTIKARLSADSPIDPAYLATLALDERKGVQTLLKQYEKKQQKRQQLHAKYQEMMFFEQKAHQQGFRFVAGIDEVGRGPLAGPVVSAAVILPEKCEILGLNDSKQLSEKMREVLFSEIQNKAIAIGIGIVNHDEIDQINIYQASKKAMLMAVDDLAVMPEYLLIDAMTLDIDLPQKNLIKGDTRSVSIAAASIIAKVFRDQLMKDYHQLFPHYGFDKNAGYGTKVHLTGLATHGICSIHRKTFAPIKNYIK